MCILSGLQKIEALSAVLKEDKKPLETYERMALHLNLVQFHMNKISNLSILDSKKKAVEEIATDIEKHIEGFFLEAVYNKDTLNLQKILRIYSIINQERAVENYFRETVVKPFMRKLIKQENISKYGLPKVYSDVLDFISSSCSTILHVTQGIKRDIEIVPGYDFLVNAVWPELMLCLEYISPVYIYAPGDPQRFHKNYTASLNFLEQFEHHCGVQKSVTRLREHSLYKDFLKKWNLDVYYQIRFQEIAGKLESSLFEALESPDETSSDFMLSATSALSLCLHLCWSENIFLMHLSASFCKLSLQLISRYIKWAHSIVKNGSLSEINAATLITDVDALIQKIKVFPTETISHKLCSTSLNDYLESFNEAVKLLEEIPPQVAKLTVQILINKCSQHLKLITDIPRLYRKTNREVPSKPSSYVTQVFNPLTEFISKTKSMLSDKWRFYCLEEAVEGIMKECIAVIHDVLTSIKKMEDSLKILKRARDKPILGGPQSTGKVITDDDKIRRQLAIDVYCMEEFVCVNYLFMFVMYCICNLILNVHFFSQVENLGLQVEDVKSFKELKELVTSAERIPVN
ncbi:conserved oligomeric Golgi complex subunit 2-like isoform X2 [Stegodyphus dumicola]|uniref:conserved oligomeric Golgi complex subunit 2-like isoform X2 n=1 Tax=Stegodyphus dumicola TaxID=202533 RepID=UPI0015B11E91|nr:conserved oligomeric Golgi complex subunit 2-like isoform X2 [Stegodyphus dumicola]